MVRVNFRTRALGRFGVLIYVRQQVGYCRRRRTVHLEQGRNVILPERSRNPIRTHWQTLPEHVVR